jgi:tRNA1(Val) A37 N6-methylase TrmN6
MDDQAVTANSGFCESTADFRSEVRENYLLAGKVRLLQPTRGFRSGLDAVFLAAAVPAEAGDRVHEAGSGAGAGALCVAARVDHSLVTGIELQPRMTTLAETNAGLNEFSDRVRFHTGDITDPPQEILAAEPFDHVMMNPPYQEHGKARMSPARETHLSRMEESGTLEDWIDYGLAVLKSQGSISIVHRADRLDDVLACLRNRAGEIAVYPLWPGEGKTAKRVVVRARKGVRSRLRMLPGMVLHGPDGKYTDAAQQILRGLSGLPL